MPDLTPLPVPTAWTVSSFCADGHCLAARRDGKVVHLRDTAAGDDATVLTVGLGDFAVFLAGAKAGDFDHLLGGGRG
jgi:hypothetical protein